MAPCLAPLALGLLCSARLPRSSIRAPRSRSAVRMLEVGGVEILNARVSPASRALDEMAWPSEWPHSRQEMTPQDPGGDGLFYLLPRFVQHAGDGARAALEEYYAALLAHAGARARPEGAAVLDLCASFTSHYTPPAPAFSRFVVVGLNGVELFANRAATERRVHNLNESPSLPFLRDASFEAVTCSLSVDYLTSPREIFGEVHRVLAPGGVASFAFTNRCFPEKVVSKWLAPFDDLAHIRLVASYFHYTGPWTDLAVADVTPPGWGTDPMFVVQARKPRGGS